MAQTYIVQGTLKHDGVTYAPGSEFSSDDAALVAQLRGLHALALPAEALSAETIAAREAELQARNAELQQELDALKAQQAAVQSDVQSEEAAASAEADKSAE